MKHLFARLIPRLPQVIRGGLLLAAGWLGAATPLLAQGPFTGKPLYRMEARRQGATLGVITLELFPAIAPHHVRNWDSLVTHHFFDSTAFHRVVPGFVIQGGDPNSRHGPRSTWGYGQASQPNVVAEFNAVSHERGILSAARDNDPNSANSQFFICVAAARSLNGNYSVYGRVTSGMAIVDQIVAAPRDANDNPLQKIEMFVTRIGSNDTLARVPQLVSPANQAVGQPEQPVLRWRRDAATMISYIQVGTDSTFASGLLYDEELSQLDTTLALAPLTANTLYYWRVRSNNGGSRSAWSAPWRFRTGAAGPTLLTPANNAFGVSTTPTLTWAAVPNATYYHVQISRSGQFLPNQITLEEDSLTTASYQVPAPGLTLNLRRYWRVRAVVAGVSGFFSTAWNFTPTVLATVDELETSDLFAAPAPNPALPADQIQLDFTLPVAGTASMTVVDLLGRPVAWPMRRTWQAAGAHQVTLTAHSLPAGVYLCRLETAGHLLTRRLVVE
jgi:cyclophilin family peptidyl-prolyl cis-trans isomerase